MVHFSSRRTMMVTSLGGIVLLVVALSVWTLRGRSHIVVAPANEATLSEQIAPCPVRRVLDGVCVENTVNTLPQLTAVMIENDIFARPQSGLAQARVVYEAPVEANFTRFMAIFLNTQEVVKAGPIRSARPYYLDWLAEYGDPLYLHVGGAPIALDTIKERNVFDLNEFYFGWYFWRSEDRQAPHNAYSSSDLWQSARIKYGKNRELSTYSGWTFATSTHPCVDSCINEIHLSFSPPNYAPVWQYVSSTHRYLRFQNNAPHIDQAGVQIAADTVVVQYVQSKTIDEVGRKQIDTVGSGRAVVFENGNAHEGFWRKDSVAGRTGWYGADGQPIALASGIIWIEVLPQTGSAEWK